MGTQKSEIGILDTITGTLDTVGSAFTQGYDAVSDFLFPEKQALPYSASAFSGRDASGNPISPANALNMAKVNESVNALNQANSFDWLGGINVGLSAWDAYNKYDLQKQSIDAYNASVRERQAQQAAADNRRAAWSKAVDSAFSKQKASAGKTNA